ncbi:MAG: HD domain-containing protein [Alphaproteobacteria bacterium]|nr:HD domain-containing protein [Alphaproteobacteria bacterium]
MQNAATAAALPLEEWQNKFEQKAVQLYPPSDPSHDILHIRRVVRMARKLAAAEGADIRVVEPAAWFHDCVIVAKNDPRRAEASRLSADAAIGMLRDMGYDAALFDAIHHAIAAHSYSAAITPETAEAKIVQDADRLDGLGAIGIARCFTVGALLSRPFYQDGDILAARRAPDDKAQTIDHFFVKLFKTVDTLQTAAGRAEGARRAAFMRDYLARFAAEAGEDAGN